MAASIHPIRRSAVDDAWDNCDTWPTEPGSLSQPQAAHAASEFGNERDDGIASGVFVWPFVMVMAGIVVGAVLAVVL